MKSLICSLLLVIGSFGLKAQNYPVTQNIGSASTLVNSPGAMKSKFVVYEFADTTAANADPYIKNQRFAIISTTSPVALWYRDVTNQVWVQILPSGSPSGLNAWLVGGNNSTSTDPDSLQLGTVNTRTMYFMTNDTKRFGLKYDGVQSPSYTVKTIGIDSITGFLSYREVGNVKPYNVLENGGDPTGLVNVGTLVNNALAAGYRFIYFPRGRWLVTTQINFKDSVTFFGDGPYNSIITLTSNITAFHLSYANGGNGSTIMDLGFYGSAAGSSQKAIMSDSAQSVRVTGCFFDNLGGMGIDVQKTATLGIGYPSNSGKGWVIEGCRFYSNLVAGLQLGNRAEYCTVSNCHFWNNATGVINDGGNNSFSGVICEYNDIGVSMTYISNSGHGNWVGGSINHNGINLYMLNQTLGFSFEGVSIGAAGKGARSVGLIELINCAHITFNSGYVVAGDTIRTTNSYNVEFNGLYELAGPAKWVVVSGDPPTVVHNGLVPNGISIVDIVNNKEMDFSHTNSLVAIQLNGGSTNLRFGIGVPTPSAVLELMAGSTSAAPIKFNSAAPTTSLVAGHLMFKDGMLILDSTASHRDTIAARNWVRDWSTGNFIALSGTSTATGNIELDLNGNSLKVSNGTLDATSIITSGTYTPSISNQTNIAASTLYDLQYLRIGDVVTVSGVIEIDPSSAGSATSFELSLPVVDVNFGSSTLCGGSAISTESSSPSTYGYKVTSQSGTLNVFFENLKIPIGSNDTFSINFTYKIQH